MNFKKLSKEKRQQLIGVVFGTLVVLGAMGYFLIRGGYQKLGQLETKKIEAQGKLTQMQQTVSQAKAVETAFTEAETALKEQERGMASGDLYSWMHSTLRRFQREHPAVDIPQIGSAVAPHPVNLLPSFPYKQTSVAVAGTAYYHDLGRFIADFENTFPLMRIINLSLDLNPSAASEDHGKLAFRMDIVALVKPQ
jgi:Tfp pilus assembly protein PilO